MKIPVSTKSLLASTLLSSVSLISFTSVAIAQTEEPVVLPAQISNQFQGFRFTATPYANTQTISVFDKDRSNTGFRSVQEEVNADAPRSESTGSSFSIRFGLDENNSDSAEAADE